MRRRQGLSALNVIDRALIQRIDVGRNPMLVACIFNRVLLDCDKTVMIVGAQPEADL